MIGTVIPNLTTEQTAQLALVVSAVVATWQVFKHLLEGPRVRVRMNAGYVDDYWLRQAGAWPTLLSRAQGEGGWPTEVAVVTVENAGRMAVTISTVSFDLGPIFWWRPWTRQTLVPRYVPFPPATPIEPVMRLEPFSSVQVLLDPWQVAQSRFSEKPDQRSVRVRASVRVAGRRRKALSPRRRGWTISPDQVRLAAVPLELGLEVQRAVWRAGIWQRLERLKMAAIPAALWARQNFQPLASGNAPSYELVEEALLQTGLFEPHTREERIEFAFLPLLARQVAEDLGVVYGVASQHLGSIHVVDPATMAEE